MQDEVRAIRGSAALSELAHVTYLRVSGEDAFAVVDGLCPADLLLRDAQMLHSLLLDDQARPLADLYVGRDDEDFLLVIEGMEPAHLAAHLKQASAGRRVDFTFLNETHAALGINGPYAWELLGEVIGPEVIGLPFGNLFHVGEWLCFRAGKTGEYGYDLLVPRGETSGVRARLEDLGRRYDLGRAGLQALDHCALENWFFNIRREGRVDVTPLELQLQWRVSYRKDYVGAAALARRRERGIKQRLTYLVSSTTIATGDPVAYDGVPIGRIVNSGFCEQRKEWVALSLQDLPWAHSGLDGLSVGAAATARTISPPAMVNRSLFVNPQRDSYFTRNEEPLPQQVVP